MNCIASPFLDHFTAGSLTLLVPLVHVLDVIRILDAIECYTQWAEIVARNEPL